MDDCGITATAGGLSGDTSPLPADMQRIDEAEDVLGEEEVLDSATPATKLSKPDLRTQNAGNLEHQLVWVRGLTIQDVTLTKDGEEVETLGPVQWSKLKMKVKEAFIKAKEIARSQHLRTSETLGKNVVNHIKAQGFKDSIKAPLRKKNSSAKPACIQQEGTFYRCINVFMSKRSEFIELKKSHDRADADSRNPKPHA
jgi:hypothetical protein